MKSHLLGLTAMGLFACASQDERPEIVTIFACSDLCPNAPETYLRQVYEGVTDMNECVELGGVLFYVVGWGTQTYCAVVDDLSE